MDTFQSVQQTTFNIYNDADSVVTVPPLLPGDRIDSITIYIMRGAYDLTEDALNDGITIGLSMMNSKPASIAAGRNSPSVVLPETYFQWTCDATVLQSVAGTTVNIPKACYSLRLTIPLYHVVDRNGLWPALLLSTLAVNVRGAVFMHFTRQE